ncbi:MAG: 4-hydroxy-3-methylbut-2-enyl diphosphate reductase [Pseudomonadota bacterium]|jgi:4-hydroxy-3-methylbut-2-enyl diphosphate reductase
MNAATPLQILLAQPRGFCAGVTRAIDIVEQALRRYGAPVYVFHEIVHNQHVVAGLRAKGTVFVDSLEEVPAGAVTVFSAHGVSRAVVQQAGKLQLHALDATCPLVTKVHQQLRKFHQQGHHLVMVGHVGHEEVEGTVGSVDAPVAVVGSVQDVQALPWDPDQPVAYVTQTTLSLDDTREILLALRARYPGIVGPELDDICYATQNRQNAVRELAEQVDLMLIVGARNSSNSTRLREVAERCGCPAHLIQDASGLDPAWWGGAVRRIGISSGASTPEVLVDQVVHHIVVSTGATVRQLDGVHEQVVFRLPQELRGAFA